MSLRAYRRRRSEINIVPLVDVLIVIIFFFLMTMQLREPRVMNITPPKVETSGENEARDPILIAINGAGEFFYNNEPVQQEELASLLALASGVSAEQSVLVIADEETPLKHVTHAMDLCRKHGLERLRLQTR